MIRRVMNKARQPNLPPAPAPRRTVQAAPEAISGFVLVVDGQMKDAFDSRDAARERAVTLKQRFPALQVRVFDAEQKQSEDVALAET